LVVVLVLNLALVAALVIVGMTAHSLAVLAEGSDYLLDAAGVAVALLAIRLSARPASRARPSPTDIAALVNCGWLLVLEVLVVSAAETTPDDHADDLHRLTWNAPTSPCAELPGRPETLPASGISGRRRISGQGASLCLGERPLRPVC